MKRQRASSRKDALRVGIGLVYFAGGAFGAGAAGFGAGFAGCSGAQYFGLASI